MPPDPATGAPEDEPPLRVLYSLAHPSDRLADERAGHVVRAVQLLAALERAGHHVTRVESAAVPGAALGARTYRSVVRRALGARLGTALRDAGRIAGNRRFAHRLLAVARREPFDVVIETQVGFSRAGAQVAAATHVPLVLDDVSPAAEDEEIYDVRLRGLARRARAYSLARATLVTAVSPAIRDLLTTLDGIDARRILLLPNGVDPGMLRPRPDAETRRAELAPPDAVVVAFAGSFQPFHRVDLLLRAAATCGERARLRVVLVGDGTERAACESLARALGIDAQVRFVGRRPSGEVATDLQAADACILPATEPYMSPMKLYEYLAVGRPVVVPDVTAVREVVGDAPVGFWFRPGDTATLAGALDRLVRAGSAWQAMGEAAREIARAHTWDARARTLVEAVRLTPPLPAPEPATGRRARAPTPTTRPPRRAAPRSSSRPGTA